MSKTINLKIGTIKEKVKKKVITLNSDYIEESITIRLFMSFPFIFDKSHLVYHKIYKVDNNQNHSSRKNKSIFV